MVDATCEYCYTDFRYYYRPYKTILVRTVQDGGESFYLRGDHRTTLGGLYRRTRADPGAAGTVAAEQTLIDRLAGLAASVDAVVVLDQVQEAECGVVTARFRQAAADVARARPNLILFADSRARIRHFRGVIIKPNRAEAMQGTPWQSAADVPAEAVSARAQALFSQNGKPVFITLGEAGILLCDAGGVQTIPAQKVTGPIDVVGAGDSATAAIVAALAAGASPAEAAGIGNLAASITIRQIGTTGAASPAQLIERLSLQNSE